MENSVGNINTLGDVSVNQYSDKAILKIVSGQNQNILKLNRLTNLEPPPLPTMITFRQFLVDELHEKLKKSTLLNLQGELGVGKTQLCNLLIKNNSDNVFWFRIREYKEQLKSLLCELISTIEKNSPSIMSFFSTRLKIPKNSIIILDDLPDITFYGLTEVFTKLIIACKNNEIKIISSSNYVLPISMNQYVKSIDSFFIPMLNNEEICELLIAYNAPEKIINVAPIINAFSDGHPTLVVASINFIKSNNWTTDGLDLFNNKFVEDEIQNFNVLFERTVSDPKVRELAYRLNNIGRIVTDKDIKLVSEIIPIIEHPFDKMNDLLNIWIFKESKDTFLLSPLLYKQGSKNLSENVNKKINCILGDNVLKNKELNPYEVIKGLVYYIKAEEFNSAGFFFFKVLISIADQENISESDTLAIHGFWVTTGLPIEMNLNIKILIRTVQIIIYKKFNKNIDLLYQEYLGLIASINKNDYFTELMSYMLFVQYGFNKKLYFQKVEDTFHKLPKTILIEMDPENVMITMLNQMKTLGGVEDLTTGRDLIAWLEILKNIEAQELVEMMKSEFGVDLSTIITFKINNEILKKIDKKEDIQEVYDALLDCSKFMLKLEINSLWVAFVSNCIECLVKLENFIEAEKLVQKSLLEVISEDDKLTIRHCLAIQYTNKEMYTEALNHYQDVLELETEKIKNKNTVVDMYAFASISLARTENYVEAKKYIEKSITLYKSIDKNDSLFMAKLYGEYAIILWEMGLELETINECEKVLFYIEEEKDFLSDEFKSLAVVLGHVLGYYSTYLRTGKPPEKILDGSIYTRPKNRMFLYASNSYIEIYDIEKQFILYYHIYNSYYRLGDNNKGKHNLNKAYENSKKSNLESLKSHMYLEKYLLSSDYEKYLNYVNHLDEILNKKDIAYLYVIPSLMKLSFEQLENKNKILEYENIFVKVFSHRQQDNFYKVILWVLKNMQDLDFKVSFDNEWLTQRIAIFGNIKSYTLKDTIIAHEILLEDSILILFEEASKKEIYEKYFFSFWKLLIVQTRDSFNYAESLLERIDALESNSDDSLNKIKNLLDYIKRYIKR